MEIKAIVNFTLNPLRHPHPPIQLRPSVTLPEVLIVHLTTVMFTTKQSLEHL